MALLSPSEIATRTGLSASQIRRLIRAGLIKAEKIGFFYVVHEEDIKHITRRRVIKKDATYGKRE